MDWCKITLGNVGGISRQMNSGITFLLVLKGTIELEDNGKSYTLGKNDVVVLNHGDLFAISGKRENGLLLINISRDYFNQHLPNYLAGSFRCNSCKAGDSNTDSKSGNDFGLDFEQLYDPIKKNIARMAFLYYKREPGYELLFQSVLFETLNMLAKDFFYQEEHDKIQDDSDQRLRSALAFIHQNYKNRISLEETAAREFLSVQYLSRLFKEHLGSTFMEYLNSLRIADAKQGILYSTNSLSRIALDNGFASVKALNAQFIKKYGCSPMEYRKANKHDESRNPIDSIQLMDDENGDSMSALAKFIQNHALDIPENVNSNHSKTTINLKDAETTPLPDFQNIVDIGVITRILRGDVHKQLEDAQKQQLRLSSVSFGGFFRTINAMGDDPMYFRLYDISEIFESFQQLGLIPIIRLETADMDLFEDIESSLESLKRLLGILQRRYHSGFFKQWKFEVLGHFKDQGRFGETSRSIETAERSKVSGHETAERNKVSGHEMADRDGNIGEFEWDRYERIYRAIKSVDPCLQVGLRIDPFLEHGAGHNLSAIIPDMPPDFLGFSYDPNEANPPSDPIAFTAFYKEYHLNLVEAIRRYAKTAGQPATPLYMMEWNTLNGKSRVEAGEFHRTALLADTLLSLAGEIDGAAVRLNLLDDNYEESMSLTTHPLSLYVYKDIRRPMFLIFKSIASLKPRIVWRSEIGFLTTDGEDRYSLLLYNACYINPFNALDNLRSQGNTLDCSILLQGLSPGRYRIKKYLLDKDNGSLYRSWLDFDFSIPPEDEDIAEYYKSFSLPSLDLYESSSHDGALQIHQKLAMNALALFIIKWFD